MQRRYFNIYRPLTKLREVNVLTGVCLFTGSRQIPLSRQTPPPNQDTDRGLLLRDTVNKRTVHILLKCTLVFNSLWFYKNVSLMHTQEF